MFSLANFHSMLALERCNSSVYFTEALSGSAFCRRFSVRVRLFPVFSGGKMTAGFCPPKLLIFFASHLQYSRRCFTVDFPEKGSLSIQPVPICPAKMYEFPTLHRARIFITAARTSILSFANLSDWRMIYYFFSAQNKLDLRRQDRPGFCKAAPNTEAPKCVPAPLTTCQRKCLGSRNPLVTNQPQCPKPHPSSPPALKRCPPVRASARTAGSILRTTSWRTTRQNL